MNREFQALMLRKTEGQPLEAKVEKITVDQLPEGDVLVRVDYSGINYKDGLAVTGKGRIVQSYPFVPGIDLVGVVEQSDSPDYRPGDAVLLTGWGVGERHWGGYAEYARVRSEWLTSLPEGISPRDAMAVGTAGLTAMLAVQELERSGVKPGEAVVVTGAAGGVGSFAVHLLASKGYLVTASTGRAAALEPYLRELGAAELIDREVLASPGKPLDKQIWKGAVDTVGGHTLGGVISRLMYGGTVAACGLAGGTQWEASVFPFILRGVRLSGIDSVYAPSEVRQEAWRSLAAVEGLSELCGRIGEEIGLSQIPAYAEELMAGRIRGRIIVKPAT